MRIYVLNLKKALKKTAIICSACAVLVLCGLLLNITTMAHKANEYQETGNLNQGRVIIIDAGHGGEDPGAIGVNGKYEKDLNLEVAMLIGEELSARGYTVIYTRTEDKMLYSEEENIKGMRKISDLKNRCAISTQNHDCIFVSVHMNTYGASKYSGLQVYYASENNESRALADKIQNSVRTSLQTNNNRTIKNGENMFLLQNCEGTPVLIECGFLSNEEECNKLSQKEYQKQLSFSIVCGIIEYMNESASTK